MKPLHLVALALVAVLVIFGGAIWAYNTHLKNQALAEVAERLVRDHSFVLGDEKAKVTVVEFFDPACPACVQISPLVASLPEKYPHQVKVIYRTLAYHHGTDRIFALLEAAKEQGKFERALMTFNSQFRRWFINNSVNEFIAWGVLEQAGIDTARAREFLTKNQSEITARLEQNMEDSRLLGITATPTFFVNGVQVDRPSTISDVVDAEVAKIYKLN